MKRAFTSGQIERVAVVAALAGALALAGGTGMVLAGPQGAQVISGNVTVTQQGSSLTTIQASNNAIINYQSFSVGAGETVRFIQPTSTSRVLNRVVGPDPSVFAGSVQANGVVYFVNPAGVYFVNGCLVNVGGLYAAASHLSDQNFLAGRNLFTNSAGAVLNYGTINATQFANLVGAQVGNFGSIVVPEGMVTMAAGKDVYIGERDGHLMVKVKGGAQTADAETPAVENAGTVQAQQVSMAAGDIYSLAIRNTGGVQAKDVKIAGGKTGTVEVGGTIDASDKSAGGTGGNVEITGEKIALIGAKIDVSGAIGGGTVLIGGDTHGANPDVPDATYTYVSSDTIIAADALASGNGGKVVVWSNDTTQFYGSISARGGSAGGNGGFVEVSGEQNLVFQGMVDAAAPAGQAGELLLDPLNLSIINTTGDQDTQVVTTTPGQIIFTVGNQPANTVSVGALSGLANTVDILLEAQNTLTVGSFNGSQSATVTLNGLTSHSITLRAGDTATVNGGNVIFNTGSSLTTGGGAVTIIAGDSGTQKTGNAVLGAISTGGGAISVTAQQALTVGANLNAGSGAISLLANQGGSGAYSFTQNASTTIQTTNATATAVAIKVNAAAGGTGGAAIRDISTGAGGTITVDTANGGATGGSITQAAGTLNVGAAGTITLTVPNAGTSGIGTNSSNYISTTSAGGTLNIKSGSGGAYVENSGGNLTLTSPTLNANCNLLVFTTGALTLPAVALNTGTGYIQLISQTGSLTTNGTLTTNDAIITLYAGGAGNKLLVQNAINSNGGTIRLNSQQAEFQNTAAGTVNAVAGTVQIVSDKIAAGDIGATITGNGGISITTSTVSGTIGFGDATKNINLNSANMANLSSTTGVTLGGSGSDWGNYAGDIALSAWTAGEKLTLNTSGGGTVHISNAINDATGTLTIYGSGHTTTISADITLASITIDDAIIVSGAATRTLTASTGAVTIDTSGFVAGASADNAAANLKLQVNTAVQNISLTGTFTNNGTQLLNNLTMAGNGVNAGTITFNAAGSGITGGINGTLLINSTANISLATNLGMFQSHGGSETIGAAATITALTGATYFISGGAAGQNITFNGPVTGAQALTVDAGAGGTITFGNTVGSPTALTSVTINNSNGTTFQNTLSAGTVTITNTTVGTVDAFQGNTVITTMNVAAGTGAYIVEFGKSGGPAVTDTITNTVTFNNTGAVNLGKFATDSLTFTNGLTHTAGATTLEGTLLTNGGSVTTAALTLNGNDVINTTNGGVTAGGNIQTNAITGGGFTLGLNSGTGGAIDVKGAADNISTLTIVQSDGATFESTLGAGTAGAVTITDSQAAATVAFQGNTKITTMNVAAGTGAYIVEFGKTGGPAVTDTITNTVTFNNTGAVNLGKFATDQLTFTNGLTHTAGTTSLEGTLLTNGGSVTTAALTLNGNDIIDTTNGAVTAGGNIQTTTITGGGFTLGLNSGTGHTIDVKGAADNISTLTIVQSDGATFESTLGAGTPGAVTITDTQAGATVAFQGNTSITTLTTVAHGYNVSFTGASNSVTNAVQFLNTGSVTFGDQNTDTITFTGGVDTVNGASHPSVTHTAGTVQTTGAALAFGLTTLDAATILATGNAAAGTIAVGAVTSGGNSLTLNSGSTAGATINLASMVTLTEGLTITNAGGLASIGTLGLLVNGPITITNSQAGVNFTGTVNATTVSIANTAAAQTVAFQGSTVITTLNVAAGTAAYNVEFGKTGGPAVSDTIISAVTFNNTGAVNLGKFATDQLTFTNGLTHTAGPTSLEGTLLTNGGNVTTAALTLNGNDIIDTTNGAVTAGGNIQTTTITGNGFTLGLNSGTANTIDVKGAADNISTLTIVQSDGATFESTLGAGTPGAVTITDTQAGQAVDFQGNTKITTLVTTDHGYDVGIRGTNNIVTNPVTFLNTGLVAFGILFPNSITTFTGGVDTINGASHPAMTYTTGTVQTTGAALAFGPTWLVDATTLATGNAAAGTINVGVVTGNSHSLTLNSGSTAGATINLTSMADLSGGLTITNAGGLATIGTVGGGTPGPVTITNSQLGVTFTSPVNATTVAINGTVSGQTVAFQGSTNITTLTTAAGGFNVDFGLNGGPGVVDVITNAVTFNNTGFVGLGYLAGDSFTFTNGVTATAASIVYTDGSIRTTGAAMNLGAAEMDYNSAMLITAGGTVTVGAINGTHAMTINAGAGDVAITGAVGGSSLPTGLTVTGNNVDVHAITTNGLITLISSTTLDGSGTPTGFLTFHSSLISNGGPITLQGNFPAVPDVATMYTATAGDNMTINAGAGAFMMGANSKLTVRGDLTITAGSAQLGDLNAQGNMSVTTTIGAIQLIARPAGNILGSDGLLTMDSGLDYVAGANITFSAAGGVAMSGAGAPARFADATGSAAGTAGFVNEMLSRPLTDVDFTFTGKVLDLRAEGLSNTDVSSAIAASVPRAYIEATPPPVISAAEREMLVSLGIYARAMTVGEFMAALTAMATYNDVAGNQALPMGAGDELVGKMNPVVSDYKVVENRISGEVAMKALALYQALFFKTTTKDGKTVRQSQADHISQVLSMAVANYKKLSGATDVDGVAFRKYVESAPSEKEALGILNSLRALFRQIEMLGLTPVEISVSKKVILYPLTVKGMSKEALETAIEASQEVKLVKK